MLEFQAFEKIARLKRELVVTEKLDGTNAQIAIFAIDDEQTYDIVSNDPYCIATRPGDNCGDSPFVMYAGSRTRYIAPESTPVLAKGCDNFAFAQWAKNNVGDLWSLGEGRHYGEWYGLGIQRNYGLGEKRFALFNTSRWNADHPPPACCSVVPRLNDDPDRAMFELEVNGSAAVPGFMKPEGIVVYHSASRQMYKQTFGNDGGKWTVNNNTD